MRDEAPGRARRSRCGPARGWRTHRAGQHVRVGVAIDGRIATRTYSISSSPDRRDGCIDDHGEGAGPGVARARHDVEVGTFVTLGPPRATSCCPTARRCDRCSSPPAAASRRSRACCARSRRADAMPDIVHVALHAAADVIFGDELRALAVDAPELSLDRDRHRDRSAPAHRRTARRARPRLARRARRGRAARRRCSTRSPTRSRSPRTRCTSSASARRSRRCRPTRAAARVRFAASAVDDARRWPHAAAAHRRGRRARAARTAAGWASATRATPRSSRAACATCAPARRSTSPARAIQICVCAAAGDVELTSERRHHMIDTSTPKRSARELDAIQHEVKAQPRRPRSPLHPARDQDPARPGARRSRC